MDVAGDEYYNDDDDCYDGDEDPEAEFDDYCDPPTEDPSRSVNGSSCKVITKECLLAAQREDLQRVMDFLSIKEHHARTLLIHYQWDVNKVFNVLIDKGKETLYAEACLIIRDDDNVVSNYRSSETFCEICMEEVPTYKTTKMDCTHRFCNICWTDYFVVKINEGQSKRINCMAHKCYTVCDEGKIRDLVSEKNPNLAEKFDRFLLESYIEDNKRVKWCPSVPHCGNAIRIDDDDEYREVECSCGFQFCFSCSSEPHSPCSCRMWKLWTRKSKKESKTVDWIRDNIKQCPHCRITVEKDGGCNLVCCICGHVFCWLCGEEVGIHETGSLDHTCGHTEEHRVTNSEFVKPNLVRYVHYNNRFESYKDSFRAQITTKEQLYEKAFKTEAVKDCSWLIEGADRLFRSRRIISYSYPFSYYIFGDDNEMKMNDKEAKKNLFEDQQKQLEAYVEKLGRSLRLPFDWYSEEQVVELRMRIINLSTLIDDLCKKLYEFIDNELLLQNQLGTKNHMTAPYRSNGVEKAVAFL